MAKTRIHILLVEDEEALAENVATFLEARGHALDFATDGAQALSLALEHRYDVVVLDLSLPKLDGLDVCRLIRERSTRHVPILMLTARDSLDDKVLGFKLGADDYLTKPFALEELEVRCVALSRRHTLHTERVIAMGPLVVDRQRRTVAREGTPIVLRNLGYRIIEYLAESYPRTVTRSELTYELWGDEPPDSDALRSHIYQVRAVLDKPFARPILKTVSGVGFVLDIESV